MMPCVPELYFLKVDNSMEKETQQHIEEGRGDFGTGVPNLAFHEYLILNLISENVKIKEEIEQLRQLVMSREGGSKENLCEGRNLIQQKKKRKYERKGQILQRKFICGHLNCGRSYSSRIALNSHLRKKHSEKKVFSSVDSIV